MNDDVNEARGFHGRDKSNWSANIYMIIVGGITNEFKFTFDHFHVNFDQAHCFQEWSTFVS